MTRLRISWLALVALLLVPAAAAFAAPPVQAQAPAPQISALCGGVAPLLAPIALADRDAGTAPVPSPLASPLTCGVCSAAGCAGAQNGGTCSNGRQILHCWIESSCTQGGAYCICASQPF
jgi:hypothetical protein